MRGPLIALSGAPGPELDQGIALARHLEGLLLGSGGGWSSVEISAAAPAPVAAETLLAATAAAGSLPFPVLSLDLAAAAVMAPARQHLLLREREEALMGALDERESGPDRVIGIIRLLQQAVTLVAFDAGAGDRLRQLGCRVQATVPLPALAPPPLPAGEGAARGTAAGRVLLVNHLEPGAAAARQTVATLKRMLPTLPLCGLVEAPVTGLAPLLTWPASRAASAAAHVHIGLPAGAGAGAVAGAPRLVDSFACRRPVLLHLPEAAGAAAGAAPAAPPISHEIDGLISRDDAGLADGLRSLLEDEVFSGILARNAERRVHAFNQSCAAALRGAVPELFG